MGGFGKILGLAAAGLLGVVGWNYFALGLTKHVLLDMPSMEADAAFAKLETRALQEHKGVDPFTALREASLQQSREQLSAAKDATERGRIAADIFLGFWLTNVRGVPDFCDQAGVDISAFEDSMRRMHAAQHAKALAVLGINEKGEDARYRRYKRTITRRVDFNMLYIKGYGIPSTKEESCKFLLEKRSTLLAAMNFGPSFPNINAILMSAPTQS